MKTIQFQYAAIGAFLWIGFICAISFMETWLKFRAPGMTLTIGLGVGRLVFQALNYIEWSLIVLIFTNILCVKGEMKTSTKTTLLFPFLLLILQTFWLLPILDARIDLHLSNAPVPASNHHFYYIAFEIIKVISIAFFGLSLFKKVQNQPPNITPSNQLSSK